VRKFFKRFAGQRLDVALEATTGWRFVIEELHARLHLSSSSSSHSWRILVLPIRLVHSASISADVLRHQRPSTGEPSR
jgi:hypothetical protein